MTRRTRSGSPPILVLAALLCVALVRSSVARAAGLRWRDPRAVRRPRVPGRGSARPDRGVPVPALREPGAGHGGAGRGRSARGRRAGRPRAGVRERPQRVLGRRAARPDPGGRRLRAGRVGRRAGPARPRLRPGLRGERLLLRRLHPGRRGLQRLRRQLHPRGALPRRHGRDRDGRGAGRRPELRRDGAAVHAAVPEPQGAA